jgi:Bacterial regulatory helix-turn-helix protein, lysR family
MRVCVTNGRRGMSCVSWLDHTIRAVDPNIHSYRLHVLRVLAACGTVNGAAATLSYTPSAVSHQIRGLARELGSRCW